MEAVKKAIGRLKTIPKIEISYVQIEEYFATGQYPPEIEQFKAMLFTDVIECTEKKSWWDWGAFIVAMLGVVQIIAGVLLEVFTAGAATYFAAGLISEGMGDIAFAIEAGLSKNFSWKSYATHKAISVAITVISCGVGAWLSRGAQAAKFAGKAGFALFKAASLRVLKKGVEAVAWKLVDMGIDKLIEVIQTEALKACGSHLRHLFTSNPVTLERIARLGSVMDTVYAHSYEKGQAERVIGEGLERVVADLQKDSLGMTIFSKAKQVGSSVASSIGKASGRLVTHENKLADNLDMGGGSSALAKAAKLAKIAKTVEKVIKIGENAKLIVDLVSISPQVLERYISHLEIQAINLKKGGDGKVAERNSSAEFSKVKEETISKAKDQVVEMFISKINGEILSPALQDLAKASLRKAEKAVERNTKKLFASLRSSDKEGVKVLKTLQRKGALDAQKIAQKLAGRIDLDELPPSTPIENAGGKTIGELKEAYGDSMSLYTDKKGNFFVERPSFETMIGEFGGNRKGGFYELMVCSNYYKRAIEITDTSGDLGSLDDNKVVIKPQEGSVSSGEPPLRLAYIKGSDGYGYFAPLVKKGGKDEIIYEVGNEGDTNGLYRSLGFLADTNKSKAVYGSEDWFKAVASANKPESVKRSLASISKYARDSPNAKFLYENGAFESGAAALWKKSGITLGRSYTRRDTGLGHQSINRDRKSLVWQDKSSALIKVSSTLTIVGVGTKSSEEALQRASTLPSRLFWEGSKASGDNREWGESGFDNLQGYPSSLVKSRHFRDSKVHSFNDQENLLRLQSFKVHKEVSFDITSPLQRGWSSSLRN